VGKKIGVVLFEKKSMGANRARKKDHLVMQRGKKSGPTKDGKEAHTREEMVRRLRKKRGDWTAINDTALKCVIILLKKRKHDSCLVGKKSFFLTITEKEERSEGTADLGLHRGHMASLRSENGEDAGHQCAPGEAFAGAKN